MIFRSADLRNRLDDSVFNTVSSRTFHAVEDYFSPLLELVSASVLWGSIGAIDSIGEPDEYIGLLEDQLELIGTISTFSMSDYEGNELVIALQNGQEKDWYITEKNSDQSLSKMRTDNGIEYMSLNQMTQFEPFDQAPVTRFRISAPYILPDQNRTGITLSLDSQKKSGSSGLTISLDLPLKQMSDRLEQEGAIKEAVIFILMPSKEDYILLPVKDLLKINESSPEGMAFEVLSPLQNEAGRIIEELSATETISNKGDIRFRFTHDGKVWLTEFLNKTVGNDTLSIGTMIPEEALWTTQAAGPLQIFLIALLGSTGFLVFRLIQDYTKVSQSPARIEELLWDEISGGESFHLEFKSSLRWDFREEKVNKTLEEIIVKSVAAFNNADGGSLLIGVADEGKILGIESDYEALRQPGKDYYEIHLRNLLSSRYGVGYTSKNIAVDFPWLSGHEICRIKIRRGREPLYTEVKTKNGVPIEKFYIRSGNTSQVLESISEITDYILSRFSRWTFGRSLSKSK